MPSPTKPETNTTQNKTEPGRQVVLNTEGSATNVVGIAVGASIGSVVAIIALVGTIIYCKNRGGEAKGSKLTKENSTTENLAYGNNTLAESDRVGMEGKEGQDLD